MTTPHTHLPAPNPHTSGLVRLSSVTGALLWAGQATDPRDAFLQAFAADTDLRGVNLRDLEIDLSGTDLSGADFRGATFIGVRLNYTNLTGALLQNANFTAADLTRAKLRLADLRGAVLDHATLDRTDLSYTKLNNVSADGVIAVRADFTQADFSGSRWQDADLGRATLTQARLHNVDFTRTSLSRTGLRYAAFEHCDLASADLTDIRSDLRSMLSAMPGEVAGVRAALQEGRIDGSAYEGQCACLVGTAAKLRQVPFTALNHPDLKPDYRRLAEVWFNALRPGHTPGQHPVATLTLQWIDEWIQDARQIASTFAPA